MPRSPSTPASSCSIEAAYFRDWRAVVAPGARLGAGRRGLAADALGIAPLSGVRQLQQHRLRPERAEGLGGRGARRLLQHRDAGVTAAVVQRLPQHQQRLAAGPRRRRPAAGALACELLRVARGDRAGAAAHQHARSRRHVRAHPARVPAADRPGAGRLRPALRRDPLDGLGRAGHARALRVDRLRADSTRRRAARLGSGLRRARAGGGRRAHRHRSQPAP